MMRQLFWHLSFQKIDPASSCHSSDSYLIYEMSERLKNSNYRAPVWSTWIPFPYRDFCRFTTCSSFHVNFFVENPLYSSYHCHHVDFAFSWIFTGWMHDHLIVEQAEIREQIKEKFMRQAVPKTRPRHTTILISECINADEIWWLRKIIF